jgi:hypothetical protein
MPDQLKNTSITDKQIDYKSIYENAKNYLVFKISITTNLQERLAYLNVLDYMEQVQLGIKEN